MDLLNNFEDRISMLKKALADKTYRYKKALTINGGYEEAKKLLLESRATAKELENTIREYNEASSR